MFARHLVGRGFAAALSFAFMPAVAAQQSPSQARHTMMPWPIVADEPAMARVQVRTDLSYARRRGRDLEFHLYVPPGASQRPLPVVVLTAASGAGTVLDRPQYTSWARLCAASGLAAIVYHSVWGQHVQDFEDLVYHVRDNADELGLRGDAIGAIAFSGNVFGHYDSLIDPDLELKCAALYYGAPEPVSSPGPLPLFVAMAGRDNAGLNQRIRRLVLESVDAGADTEWVVHADGHHAFDILDDDPRTHAILRRTMAFFAERLGRHEAPAETTAAVLRYAVACYSSHEWDAAIAAYRRYLAVEPNDAYGWFRLAQCSNHAERYGVAAEALVTAAELGFRRSTSLYDAACMRALEKRVDDAFALLERAIAAGFGDAGLMAGDEDLVALRADQRFDELLRKLK